MQKIILASIILLSSFNYSCKVKPTEEGTVFRSAFESDVPSLDSIQIGDTTSHDVGHNIYSTLVTYRTEIKKEGEKLTDIVPDLAESWEISKDGKIYKFKIRKNVKFHNGRDLSAEDIKYSIERIANPKNASKGLWTLGALPFKGLEKYQKECQEGKKSNLEGVKVIDKYTLVLEFEKFVPFILHVLTMPYYAVVPKEEVEKWGKDFSSHPVGTGPFMFKEWKKGKEVVLVKNPYYFEKGKPYLDKLVYQIIPSDVIRLGRFENQQLEYIDNTSIPSARFESILNDKRWNPIGAEKIRELDELVDPDKNLLMKQPRLSTEYLGMNVTKEPFTDKRVRKAFNYAINKQKIVDRVYNGRRVIAKGVLPPGFPAFDEKREVPYPYDPDKAIELLNQAGWKDTDGDGFLDKNGKKFSITLWHNQREILAALCSSVQADLKDIGIEVDVRALQWAPYIEKVRKQEAIFFRFGWQADYPDPDNFLWTLFSSDNIGQDNSTMYSNKEVDKLLNEARNISDWKKREELYRKAESIIIDDAPWVFLENEVEYKIVQPYVKGLKIHPLIPNDMKIVRYEYK
ncbi:MAG: peptide ABC transporter substrate-binding protein [Candidatus Sericytochromatia bacterium]|nr:MAG: peptide ABC transporter substrate-binding protein [Candidatus Sericytochromatia bacterium]